MRKYKKNETGELFLAEISHRGMEDGFICYESCNGDTKYKCEDCGHYLPYIITKYGKSQFVFGDYFVTNIETCERHSVNYNAFLDLYELVP